MPTQLAGATAVVTGASRGFGRAIATALCAAGAYTVGVARSGRIEDVTAQLGDSFTPVVADAADARVAAHVIDRYRPQVLVLNAGALPPTRPIHHQSWQTFSRNWEVDVQHVFHWTRQALRRPLDPGATVVALSSGAAVNGSPLSGGYAGAKATIRFITTYANAESERDALGIRFASMLPTLTPSTDLGAVAVAAYAARQGVDVTTFLVRLGPALTPERVAGATVDLITNARYDEDAYLLTPTGLESLE